MKAAEIFKSKKYMAIGATSVLIISVLVFLIASVYYSDDRVPGSLKETPLAEIQLVDHQGELLDLEVRFMENPSSRHSNVLRGAGINTVQNTILYYSYDRNRTWRHSMNGIRAPLDMAFFDEEGTLITVISTETGKGEYAPGEFRARIPYKYILMTRKGFFEENSIFEDEEQIKLLPDTLKVS